MAKNTQIIEVKTKGAKKSKKELNGVSKGLKGMAKSAGIAAGAYFGAKGLLSGLTASINLYKEQELAEVKLRQALGKSIGSLQSYASSLQKVTNFGDELILQGMAQLAFFIKDEEQLKVATKATLDLASAKGMDLVQAADLVAKSVGSSTNALSRYGIAAEGAVGSEERLLSITDEISNLFGGQAEATTQSLSGALDQLNNAVGDTQEAIGEALAPTVKGIAGFFQSAAESASSFFLEMTESDIETTIRKLQDAGVSAEALEGLQLINFKEQLAEINSEIEKQGVRYDSVAEAQKKIQSISEGTKSIDKDIIEGIDDRKEKLGRLRGLLDAQKNLTLDTAGNYLVLNEVTGKQEKIAFGNLDAVIATQKATLGYAQTTVGLQDELDGVTVKTKQITDNAERQLDNAIQQSDQLTKEIGLLTQKEEIEAKIAEIQEGNPANDPVVIDEFQVKLDAFIEKKQAEAEATQLQIDLNDAYILTMREQGKMLDVMTSKEKKNADEKNKGAKRTLETIDSIGKLAQNEKVASISSAISSAYEAANTEFSKYSKRYPAPLGTILGIAAAKAAVDRGIKNVNEIKKAQYGADFVTSGPQMMMVGEGSGPERVQVTPLSDPNIDGPTGQPVTVNVLGSVIGTEEFTESTLIPQIKEGLRLGERI